MGRQVVNLGSRRAFKETVVGGKGAKLSRLSNYGFSVPPGFVITTEAFRKALNTTGHGFAFNKEKLDQEELDKLREAFLSLNFPQGLKKEILSAYKKLDGAVAVRSSIVGEDSRIASFAGQLDSFLNIKGDLKVLKAVTDCMASAFGYRLWKYINTKGNIPKENIAMAVIVQRMIQSDISGVMFSSDLSLGGSFTVIEAVRGLGDSLGQGFERPDHYKINRKGQIVEFSTAQKLSPILNKDRLIQLTNLAWEIEKKFKSPQDIEWAFDGSEFFILQSRPIASANKRRFYSNRLVSDMAPGLVKPLVWSTKYTSMNKNVFVPLFRAVLGPVSINPDKFTKRFFSRVYADMTMFGELLSQAGFPQNFFEAVARDDRISRYKFQFHPRMIPVFIRVIRFVLGPFRIQRNITPFLIAKEAELDEYRLMNWETESSDNLVKLFHQLNKIHGTTQWYTFIVSLNMAVRSKILNLLIRNCPSDVRPVDILKGYFGKDSFGPLQELKKMALHASELDSQILNRILSDEDFDIQDLLARTPEGQNLLEAFKDFMHRFGFLSANESDFSEIPWIETPQQIWKTVAGMAQDKHIPNPTETQNQCEKALKTIRLHLSFHKRFFFDRLHRSTIRFMRWRDRISSLMAEETYLMRRCALALAGNLMKERIISMETDIFYIYADELEEALRISPTDSNLLNKIKRRRAQIEKDAALDPPESFYGDENFVPIPPPAPNCTYLSGISGSSGTARGKARIVRNPFHVQKSLSKTEILIVPFTDLGWTPFLAGIGGIVAETGGQLSHTSIIAREYGIPAVVSVPKATSVIRDGQYITIDGTEGRVYLNPKEEA